MSEAIRDAILIEERLVYENNFFRGIFEDIEKSNQLDFQIEDYEPEFIYEEEYFDYDFADYDPFDDYYFEEFDRNDVAFVDDGFQTFPSNDDSFDRFEEYDYPDGPDENLNGVRYFEEYFLEYDEPFLDFDEPYECSGEYLFDKEQQKEESFLNKLIEEHLKEEKQILEEILEYDSKENNFCIE